MTNKNIYWALSLKRKILTKLTKLSTKKDPDFNLLCWHLETAFRELEEEIPDVLVFSTKKIENIRSIEND
jgi:hypothetical protein